MRGLRLRDGAEIVFSPRLPSNEHAGTLRHIERPARPCRCACSCMWPGNRRDSRVIHVRTLSAARAQGRETHDRVRNWRVPVFASPLARQFRTSQITWSCRACQIGAMVNASALY